ncbi:MAG: CapA family protein, partial [Crenarchaeota archaeon]|nr:CapA family protein [Thermoproteota archaeon]
MIKIKKIFILLTLPTLLFSCQKIEDVALIEEKVTNVVTNITTTTDEVFTTTEAKPENVKISFSCTGDNLIHSSIYEQASFRAGGGGNYDFTRAYENIADLIQTPDVAVLNQETLICNDVFAPSSYPCFNSPTALGNHMIDLGFDVFTTANNHTLDKGVDGLLASLDYWASKENSTVVGVYRNLADKENIRTRDVKGV